MSDLLIDVVDGSARRAVPAAWLRLHCPCVDCSFVDIGERRVMVTSPIDWAVGSVQQLVMATKVTWASGHVSLIPPDFVASMEAKASRRQWMPHHWDGFHRVHEVEHDDFVANLDRQCEALLAYRNEGVIVLRGLPLTETPTEDFLDALRIPIWEGPFGLRSIDTRVQEVAYNVSETAEALPPHNDLAGYQWPPSGQILHMLVNRTQGGDSLVIDGLRVLTELRRDAPALFDVLALVPVGHRLYSGVRETFARAPIIRLDAAGEVAGMRFSNQTIQPLPLGEPLLEEWHVAYAELARRLSEPGQAASFLLEAGDAYLTHAHRVLHARTAFTKGGDRCIRDAYFEFDNVLAVLDQLTGEVV